MKRRAWSKGQAYLDEIERRAEPAFKRYRQLVAKRYDRSDPETKEMVELRQGLNKLERFYRGILAKNPLLHSDKE